MIGIKCIKCGKCESKCPVTCIIEEEGKYVIDEEACVECGVCARVCPVDAPEEKT
jgi:ferredoxin